jgi:integrase
VRTFLRPAEDDRLYAAWLLAATTGMRRGEVLGLRREDLNLAEGRLSVTQSVVLVDGRPIISEPKTAKGRRRISLDPATIAALRAHLKRQAEDRLAWGPAYQDSGLVFTREDGIGVHREVFADRFASISARASLPGSACTISATPAR